MRQLLSFLFILLSIGSYAQVHINDDGKTIVGNQNNTDAPSFTGFLKEGKVWNCFKKMYWESFGLSYEPDSVTVCGDTVYHGYPCKLVKLVYHKNPEKVYLGYYMEKDNRIYSIDSSGEVEEEMNFNLSVGDIDGFDGQVTDIDSIIVNGIKRKRITLKRNSMIGSSKYYTYYIVEGIGMSDNALRYEYANSYYHELYSVFENGKCVFRASDFLPDRWKYPEPESRGFQIEDGAFSTDTMYLYNIGAKGYFTEGNTGGTQASFGDTGLEVCFCKYISENLVGADSVWEGTTYEMRVFSKKNGSWGSAFLENENEMFVDYGGQGNKCRLFQINDKGWYFQVYGTDIANYFQGYYSPYTFMGVGEYDDGTMSRIIYPLLDQCGNEGRLYEAFMAYHTEWAFVTKADYEAHQKKLQTYRASQELLAALNKAKSLELDTSAEQAVYDNTDSSTEELLAATNTLNEKVTQYETAIKAPEMGNEAEKNLYDTDIFNLQGIKIISPSKGIHIIRYRDGKTRKVYRPY